MLSGRPHATLSGAKGVMFPHSSILPSTLGQAPRAGVNEGVHLRESRDRIDLFAFNPVSSPPARRRFGEPRSGVT